MKTYNANYTDKSDRCWSLTINAENWKEARKIAGRYGKEEKLTLYSVRLDRDRQPSYGELAALEEEFTRQCEAKGVKFEDEETETGCRMDFIDQYVHGSNKPKIRIL